MGNSKINIFFKNVKIIGKTARVDKNVIFIEINTAYENII